MSCKSCSSFNSNYTTTNLSFTNNLSNAITKINDIKKIDNYFFYENINHYTKSMTVHSTISAQQNQEFLSTMHTMIDDLDTISHNIDENTYLRLVNGLQRLYNIVNSSNQTSSPNYETINQTTIQSNNEVEITRILAQHYGRVYDSSGVLISNEPYPINNTINANAINNYDIDHNVDPNIINVDTNVIANAINNYDIDHNVDPNIINVDTNVIANENNENNEAHNQQAAYISYVALYNNAFDYWNQPQHRFRRTN